MSDFTISTLPLAGGELALSPIPGRYGDYAADIAAWRDYGPAVVITMTTADEIATYAGDTLADDVASWGGQWVHFAVRDLGAPDSAESTRWAGISTMARQALDAGGRVLIHCRGGCGRSGMAALRLMVDCGEDGTEALTRLRATRPCAAESDAQLKWARG